ncbi:MAG: hypothetical protein MUP49_06270 [Dehalococcoidia bacterium]|nr:hypothetical protein [Dehalococcoidia bacterium]
MADSVFESYEVNIEKAQAAMDFMTDYIKHNSEKISKAEAAAKNSLMGLILTGVETGVFNNATPQITQIRDKIFMAFDFGYFYGSNKKGNDG